MIIMKTVAEVVKIREESFKTTEENINQILKNVDYKVQKSKSESPYCDTYKYKKKIEICNEASYSFDIIKGIHPSSVHINCCGSDCYMNGDLVIKKDDKTSEDALWSIFNEETCSITDTHSHADEKHIHILCNTFSTDLKNKLNNTHNLLIK